MPWIIETFEQDLGPGTVVRKTDRFSSTELGSRNEAVYNLNQILNNNYPGAEENKEHDYWWVRDRSKKKNLMFRVAET